MRSVIRHLVVFDVLCAIGSLRWAVVPTALFIAGYLAADRANYDPYASTTFALNLWDGPLSMMVDSSTVVFFFALGFAFIIGDLYVRDRSSGTATMTLIRSRSRTTWWTAKIVALGILALVYSIIGFCSALAGSAVRLPWSWSPSPTADIPWGTSEALYPRFTELPMPVFFSFVVLYTALALWAFGALVLVISVFYPRSVVPLAATLAWVIVGSPLVAPLFQRQGLGTLDPMYHLSYAVHFGTPDVRATRWTTSLAIIGTILALVLLLGAQRLRSEDM